MSYTQFYSNISPVWEKSNSRRFFEKASECFRYRVGQVQVTAMPHDGEDKLIPIVQEVIELRASSQGGRRLEPMEVSGCGQDELFACIIRAVGHLAAVPGY